MPVDETNYQALIARAKIPFVKVSDKPNRYTFITQVSSISPGTQTSLTGTFQFTPNTTYIIKKIHVGCVIRVQATLQYAMPTMWTFTYSSTSPQGFVIPDNPVPAAQTVVPIYQFTTGQNAYDTEIRLPGNTPCPLLFSAYYPFVLNDTAFFFLNMEWEIEKFRG